MQSAKEEEEQTQNRLQQVRSAVWNSLDISTLSVLLSPHCSVVQYTGALEIYEQKMREAEENEESIKNLILDRKRLATCEYLHHFMHYTPSGWNGSPSFGSGKKKRDSQG